MILLSQMLIKELEAKQALVLSICSSIKGV